MGLIDVGKTATNRASTFAIANRTQVAIDNPANDTGTITSVELWYNSAGSGVKVGTFYGSGTSYTPRDFETIGNVTSGSKQTFSGLSIDVQVGDFIGYYDTSGGLDADTSGGTSYTYSGDGFSGTQTYSSSTYIGSLYGTGATIGFIDIGPGTTDLPSYAEPDFTGLTVTNPANASGTITSFEIWAYGNGTGVKIGTFYGSETSWTNRDYETIGNVTAGSKQTFSGLSCDVQTNDIIGSYFASGNIELSETGGPTLTVAGDQFGTGAQTYSSQASREYALYGTGATTGFIDIGYGISNTPISQQPTNSRTCFNPGYIANDTGVLDTIKLYFYYGGADGSSVKVGTIYNNSGMVYTIRDYATIGTVTQGSVQTFSGLSIDVTAGDFLAFYNVDGQLGLNNTIPQPRYYCDGDQFGTGQQTYTDWSSNYNYLIYGTGATVSGWTGKINGVTNPAKIMGIAVANIAKVNGI